MKIIHVIPGIDIPTNGVANAAKRIAAEQVALGHDVRLTGCVLTSEEAKWSDIVFVHSMFKPIEWMSCWRAWRARKQLVRMPHGCLDPLRFRYHWWKKLPVLIVFEWFCFRISDAIYATCNAEARWTLWLRRPIINVPLGVDLVDDGLCSARPSASTGSLRLLYLGRLHPLKGVDCLIEALARIEGVTLEIVASDEKGLQGEYEALVARLGLSRRVVFRGELFAQEKDAAFERCDLFVLPTLSENFGLVIGEAYAHQKPVITTDGASSWEDIAKVHAGWYLVPYTSLSREERIDALKSALEAALRSRDDLPMMGAAGLAYVCEHFDWKTNVARLMRALERLEI